MQHSVKTKVGCVERGVPTLEQIKYVLKKEVVR